MSLIQKLGIIGIRSYSPHKVSEIEFGKPITLILGHNGAGKTVKPFTIIECLRQITTSTFPPFSQNGHTFIQDPAITNSPELKAQLKLRFQAMNGKQIFACKTFSISRTGKGKSDSFRTTESYLKTKNESGEIMSINHTCSEMDKQVPALMGVSKEILENVVFCHQEEANWPLGDSQDLRQIFDELFGTERMTKVVECLRQVKKEMTRAMGGSMQQNEWEKQLGKRAEEIDYKLEERKRLDQLGSRLSEEQKVLKELSIEKKSLSKVESRKEGLIGEIARLEFEIEQKEKENIKINQEVKQLGGDGLSAETSERLRFGKQKVQEEVIDLQRGKTIKEEELVVLRGKMQEVKNELERIGSKQKGQVEIKINEIATELENLLKMQQNSWETNENY